VTNQEAQQVAPPLTGQELLAAIEIHTKAGLKKRQVIMACGYVSKSKDGRSYARTADFYDALSAAKGLQIGSTATRAGRQLSFQTQVQSNGAITLSAAYAKRLGLSIGDKIAIHLFPEDQSIKLRHLPGEDEVVEEVEEAAAA